MNVAAIATTAATVAATATTAIATTEEKSMDDTRERSIASLHARVLGFDVGEGVGANVDVVVVATDVVVTGINCDDDVVVVRTVTRWL